MKMLSLLLARLMMIAMVCWTAGLPNGVVAQVADQHAAAPLVVSQVSLRTYPTAAPKIGWGTNFFNNSLFNFTLEVIHDTVPLSRAHAHNDYYHQRPLRDAMELGFVSVEADLFLVDGELLVGHDRWELHPQRTLERLYLEPLAKIVAENGGCVFDQYPEQIFWLHIDVKSAALETFIAIQKQLEQFPTLFHANSKTDQTPHPAPVRVVISGNRDYQQIANAEPRIAGIDGRMEDLNSELPAEVMPLLSDNWRSHFTWSGRGEMPVSEREKLHRWVQSAHASGRKVRLWGTPENRAVWSQLIEADVDFINTDQLQKLKQFLLSVDSRNDQQRLN